MPLPGKPMFVMLVNCFAFSKALCMAVLGTEQLKCA